MTHPLRGLRFLAATLLALHCSAVFGVGLGELELKSALNQRFDAEIELTSVGDLETDEILPNLASQSDFDRVGVERNYELTDLRFNVRVREDGQYIVQVTSTRPIIEPFLNFIVEAIWPTGRILREYTVLLDPPVFGTGGVEKIDPAAVSGSSASGSSSSSGRVSMPGSTYDSGRMSSAGAAGADEIGMTGQGDTLWAIASRVRPGSDVSVQQTMLALQRANPDAFINNNINLLKAGYVLRIPDRDEILAETREEAIAEVSVQNEEFAEYKAGEVTQLDARRTARRERTTGDTGEDGELKLLAADDSGSRSGSGGDARSDELEDALAVAQEDLDRARRANTELNVRLDDLAGQVETLNEIVKLKDDQLAALRAELQKAQSAPSTTPSAGAVTTPQQSQSLLQNPLVLGGLGVLLIGGIAAALIMRRRRQESSDDEEFEVLMDEPEEELSLNDEIAGDDEEEAAEEEDEDVTQQTSDVIGEAEIYIAYGRFPQAISFLQQAIENEPNRADVQLKLLEVYVQTEDATAFNLQLEQLKALGDDDATAKALELQAQIPGAAETAEAAMDATIVSSEPIAAIEEPADDDDDLSFDLDDLDAETEDDDLDSLDIGGGDDLSEEEALELGDADLDLDLDAALEESAEAAQEEELALDLDLDEDIDLDFSEDGGEELDLGGDDDDDALDLGDLEDDDDALDLGDLEDDDDALDLGALAEDDDDDALDLGDLEDDDDALDLGALADDDDDALDLGSLDDDDDALDLSDLAEEDDDDALDLGDLADDDELDLGDDLELDLDDDLELDLDDDDPNK